MASNAENISIWWRHHAGYFSVESRHVTNQNISASSKAYMQIAEFRNENPVRNLREQQYKIENAVEICSWWFGRIICNINDLINREIGDRL